MTWQTFHDIIKANREEIEKKRGQKLTNCPDCDELLVAKKDGTLVCKFCGTVIE